MQVRPRKRQPPPDPRTNRQMVQLIVCVAILGLALVVRLIKPEVVTAFVSDHIQDGWDVQQTLTSIGESVRDVFSAPTPEPKAEESPSPSSSLVPSPSVELSPVPDVDEEGGLSDSGQTGDDAGIGGFGEPVLFLTEGLLPTSEEIGLDDTYPIPFGTQKPDKVDYTVYELPFEYQKPLADAKQSSIFGYRVDPFTGVASFHYGLDLAASGGTEISAFAGGKVVAVGLSDSYGNYIMVQHSDEYLTMYAHCSKIIAKEGASVDKGDVIAKVGSTGRSTGPHLHFEIRKGASLLNPASYISYT